MNSNPRTSPEPVPLGETFIDAREAARRLNLPLHWLTHPNLRAQRRTPCYRIGVLVRFRLSELEAWLQRLDSENNKPSSPSGSHA